jgi:hypothetical protein
MTIPTVFNRHRGGFAGLVEPVDDGALFGRPQDHVTAEDKARAAAEWAAMDDRGQLPEGWTWNGKLGEVRHG